MNYDNSAVRRQDRLLEPEEAARLLSEGEYGFLSVGGEEGGYGIPLNYVYHAGSIYFHCAPEGEKLRYMESCNTACFCVVGRTAVQAHAFTTEYESILVFGSIGVVADEEECTKALQYLIDKYSPRHKEAGMKYARSSLRRTKILRLDIARFSGKCNRAGGHL